MKSINFLNHSIIAHRGIYNNITIYENTIESVMYAVNNNLTVEIDLQYLKDGNIILFHDSNMERLIHLKDDINTINYNDLEFISKFHIPKLEEVLNIIDGRVPVIFDIKSDDKDFLKKITNLLINYKGDFVIQSFNYEICKYLKNKLDCNVGLIIDVNNNYKYLNKVVQIDFMSVQYDLLNKFKLNELKHDYYVIGYTIDNKDDVNYYIKLYNNIIVDNIEEMYS